MTQLRLQLRAPLPSVLIAPSLPPERAAELRSMLGADTSVEAVATVDDAARTLLLHVDACLVLVVPSDASEACMKALGKLRSAFPRVPAMAVFLHGFSSYRGALQIGSVGVTEVIEANPGIDRQALLAALTRCHSDSVAHRVWEIAAIDVPEDMRLPLRSAIRLAHRPVTVVKLASVLGLHERTLRKYCEQKNLPSPQWIIGWARILTAAYYLDEPARSLRSVAELLSYASACALRNQLRRYARMSPSQLRAEGALRTIGRELSAASRGTFDHVELNAREDAPVLRLVKTAPN